jgi:hypothetical protein
MIPVEADVAAVLQADPERRAAVGRLVSMVVHPTPDADPLLATMRELSADARALGLTPALLEEELAAHKAERRR